MANKKRRNTRKKTKTKKTKKTKKKRKPKFQEEVPWYMQEQTTSGKQGPEDYFGNLEANVTQLEKDGRKAYAQAKVAKKQIQESEGYAKAKKGVGILKKRFKKVVVNRRINKKRATTKHPVIGSYGTYSKHTALKNRRDALR